MRLEKFIAECGVASRRSADELVKAGNVTVNGVTVREAGTRVDPSADVVRVRRRVVVAPQKGIILLNKPKGVVTSLSDPGGRPTVAEFLTTHYRSYYPAGRLDYDSSGLVVMTNDGDVAERLMHPRYEMERVYHVRVEGRLTERTADRIARGVKLQDGPVRAGVRLLEEDRDHTWVEIRIGEGRNRIIRRMMEHVGLPVEKLKRVSHGPFRLGKLQVGQVRKLTEKEYKAARAAVLAGRTAARETSGDLLVRRPGPGQHVRPDGSSAHGRRGGREERPARGGSARATPAPGRGRGENAAFAERAPSRRARPPARSPSGTGGRPGRKGPRPA